MAELAAIALAATGRNASTRSARPFASAPSPRPEKAEGVSTCIRKRSGRTRACPCRTVRWQSVRQGPWLVSKASFSQSCDLLTHKWHDPMHRSVGCEGEPEQSDRAEHDPVEPLPEVLLGGRPVAKLFRLSAVEAAFRGESAALHCWARHRYLLEAYPAQIGCERDAMMIPRPSGM